MPHYSIRTEDAYVLWAKRYIHYHGMRHPSEMGKQEIEQFLSYLANERNVAAATHDQALSALLFVILAREAPPTPPCADAAQTRALMLDGLKNALSNRTFWLILMISFLGMAIFNGITTWVENIVRPRNFTPADAGTLGAILLV